MKSKKRTKAKRLSSPATMQTAEIPPTSTSDAEMPSMFNKAQNTNITGGSFSITTNINTGNTLSLDVLYRRVAPNAILNAGGRADEVRCHPGTREEVIGRIEKWGETQDGLTAPIFWLSGPAGAGKTAIIQTIAERCNQSGIPHANFFFFRADNSRSNASPLLATLLHQIILLYPSLRDPVATVLSTNPLIFDSILENQLVQLIATPLRSIQQSSSDYRPLMLLIDGLDECDSDSKRSQQQILHAFDNVLAEHPCLICLLVASRDESQIRAAFNRIYSKCLHLYLDDQYFPENDIHIFVNAQFDQVRRTHPLAHTLDSGWPSVTDVNFIVKKSSGQFIYAATVMRFILDSSASPMVSLERVQGAVQLATKLPFPHLDAIYSYVLSQVDDQDALKDILHAQILIQKCRAALPQLQLPTSTTLPSLIELLGLYDRKYSKVVVLSCLADLTPISQYESNADELLFHHASFPDYLLDKSRSMNYFVDITAFSYKILPIVWELIETELPHESWVSFGLGGLIQLQNLPPGLIETLISSKNAWSNDGQREISAFASIYNLCISDDDVVNFRRLICRWISGLSLEKVADIRRIPFGSRYFEMARADRYCALDEQMTTALCPETDFDRQESALWLKNLLSCIHRKIIYSSSAECYKQLLTEWVSWAVENGIPYDVLDHFPDATNKKPVAPKLEFRGSRK